jgi:hypothetical protein
MVRAASTLDRRALLKLAAATAMLAPLPAGAQAPALDPGVCGNRGFRVCLSFAPLPAGGER